MCFVCIAFVVDIFPYAPYPVAAHFRFTAVRVEDAHPEIGGVGGRNIDHAVRSCAEMAIGQFGANLFNSVRDFAPDIEIVVPESLHFGELHVFLL